MSRNNGLSTAELKRLEELYPDLDIKGHWNSDWSISENRTNLEKVYPNLQFRKNKPFPTQAEKKDILATPEYDRMLAELEEDVTPVIEKGKLYIPKMYALLLRIMTPQAAGEKLQSDMERVGLWSKRRTRDFLPDEAKQMQFDRSKTKNGGDISADSEPKAFPDVQSPTNASEQSVLPEEVQKLALIAPQAPEPLGLVSPETSDRTAILVEELRQAMEAQPLTPASQIDVKTKQLEDKIIFLQQEIATLCKALATCPNCGHVFEAGKQ